MVVFDPVKVVITNYEQIGEKLPAENNPEDANAGHRDISFNNELFIEREDFMENPPKKYFRLAPGQKVRLKHAYIIQCDELVKDESGKVIQLNCSYFPDSKSGEDTSGIHVKGTLHWVNAKDYISIQINEYDRLFTVEDPAHEGEDFTSYINPQSLTQLPAAFAEPSLADASLEQRFQFLRKGYFVLDKESSSEQLVFNRTVTLKDSWAKQGK
ncbi:MAG TPA: glutamine--tRNA ligase, partial [Niabella sp.]|nr:glutamine--tRNA ligase [Niabella sp.]